MSDRKFCDFCGKEITGRPHFDVTVYDPKRDAEISTQDACKSCSRKVQREL